MTAYMIVDTAIHDAATYERYKAEVPALIRKHGGEYLVRGGAHEVIEGDWKPTRLVVFRFPNRAAVHAFFDDPDYAPLKSLRHGAAASSIVVVDGMD